MTELQLGTLSSWIEQGRLDPYGGKIITMKELLDSGAVHGVKEGGVKLLGNVSNRRSQVVCANAPTLCALNGF